MRIILYTERWTPLWLSNLCWFQYNKGKYELEQEFKDKVSNAKKEDRLKVINSLSLWEFKEDWKMKYKCKDYCWNIMYLQIIDN